MKDSQKHSVYEKSKRNPTKLILLLILVLIFSIKVLYPKTKNWQEKGNFIQTNTPILVDLEKKELQYQEELKDIKKERDDFRKDKYLDELQRYPETLDTQKIVRIIELYALQLKNLDKEYENSFFELHNIRFGREKVNEEKNVKETTFKISFSTDMLNFKEFIHFLQSGKLSERIKIGMKNEQIDFSVGQFLETQILPLLHISSIQYEEIDEESNENDYIEVDIEGVLFSQSPQKDE